MDIRQEKQFIYELMQNITNERRKLSEDYFDLKKRLDRLDELEMRGLDDISVDGYFNLHEKRQRQLSASNIRRELDNMDKKMNAPLNPKFQNFQPERPAYQPSLEEVRQELEKSVANIEKEPEPETKIPKAVLEEAIVKEKENKNVNKTKTKKRRQALDFNKVGAVIRIILKESGRPMEMSEIQKEVEAMMEVEITDSNFRQNLMYRANKEYKDIVRVGRGIYEFISDEGDRKRKEVASKSGRKPEVKKDTESKEADEPIMEQEEKQESFKLVSIK